MQQAPNYCTPAPEARLDGIHLDQHKRLSKKSKSGSSEKEKWFEIWDILFPENPRPASPYIDSRLSACCSTLREHWQNSGPEILLQVMRDSGILSGAELDETARHEALRRVLAQGLDTIWDLWISREGSSQPTLSRSSSSSGRRGNTENSGAVSSATPAMSFEDSALGSQLHESETSGASRGSMGEANTDFAIAPSQSYPSSMHLDPLPASNTSIFPAHDVYPQFDTAQAGDLSELFFDAGLDTLLDWPEQYQD